MKHTFIYLFLIFGLVHYSLGAEIFLSGVYQGKNIYVQNPFSKNVQEYCTNEVYVNNKLVINNPKVGAFEIDLSHLSLNTPVEIRIIYKDGCGPQVVNPQVITFDNDFKFLTCQVNDSEVKWITEKESLSGIYTIERLEEKKGWVPLAEISSKGSSLNNFYKIATKHLDGKNLYRIKFTQAEGLTLYSREIEFSSFKPNP